MILFLPLLLTLADPVLGTAAHPLIVETKPGCLESIQLGVSIVLGVLTWRALKANLDAVEQARRQAKATERHFDLIQEQQRQIDTDRAAQCIAALEATKAFLAPLNEAIQIADELVTSGHEAIYDIAIGRYFDRRDAGKPSPAWEARKYVYHLTIHLRNRGLAPDRESSLTTALIRPLQLAERIGDASTLLAIARLNEAMAELREATRLVDTAIYSGQIAEDFETRCSWLVVARENLMKFSTSAVEALLDAQFRQADALRRLSASPLAGTTPSPPS